MSDDKGHDTPAATNVAASAAAPAKAPTPAAEPLPELMAKGAPTAADLDAKALRAAQQAIADGERALAAARTQLRLQSQPASPNRRRRDIALGVLLFVNLVAMVVLAMLPPATVAVTTPPAKPSTPVAAAPTPPQDDAALRRFNEPFQRALAAADRGDYATAITTLDAYLAGTPSLQPSQQLNVLNMLSHYAGLAADFKKSQEYAQRAAAIGQSHSLPADLVAMAKAAAESGDQESLRRVWARFLLQQRQVPTWLYKHVAEAYLQLGDSYRNQADTAAERERVRQLQETAGKLGEAANAAEGRK